jgi:outer membrane protein assembly factor BamB
MGRSLAIAFICSLGLAAFSAGCSKDEEGPGDNGTAGTTSGVGGANGGAGGAAGESGQGGAAGESGQGGAAGTTSGAGGAAGTTSGAGGVSGVGGAGGGDSGAGGTGANDGKTWSHLGYDQTNTYFNPGEKTISVETAPMLVKKWEFDTGGVPHGGVSIAEGKVFVTTLMGTYGLDVHAGTMVWVNAAVSSESTAAYDGGFVYVHSTTGYIHKLKASDGTEVWKTAERSYELDGCDGTSSAVVGGGKVLVGHSCGPNEVGALTAAAMSKGGVEAFDTETGERAWSYTTVEGEEDGAMVWSTVSIDLEAGMVFAATGNNYTVAGPNSDSIHAIDLEDGTRMWKAQVRAGDAWTLSGGGSEDTDFGANPILATIGGRKVVAAGDKASAFWVLDRMDGTEIWKKEDLSSSHLPQNGGVLNNGAFDGERFFVASNQPPSASVFHGLNAADGMAAWPAKNFPKIIWGMPTIANGVLAVPVNNELHLFNAATGDSLNMFTLDGTVAAGAPAIADGMIVVKSGMQYLFAFADAIVANKVYGFGMP